MTEKSSVVRNAVRVLVGIVVVLWGLEVADLLIRILSPYTLDGLGIRPRRKDGLIGILCAPFLHGDFKHLAGNTVPLFLLSILAMVGGLKRYLKAVLVIVLVAGLGTWLFGAPNSLHIGASGVVFGLAGYVFARGIFSRQLKWIVLSLIVAVAYWGLFLSLFQIEEGISWVGHAFGLVGGLLAAWAEGTEKKRWDFER